MRLEFALDFSEQILLKRTGNLCFNFFRISVLFLYLDIYRFKNGVGVHSFHGHAFQNYSSLCTIHDLFD